eukprot:TRINITY_DN66616_c2_g1_i1.p1 TRINITY_DN66616_c2_g1~~TRINITY_DN66616_c2_g1_i1.p1  ORF type:complete len:497 (-),score=286.67 TRINITY_DN66616_c2_g1_i1:54-1508(-)
MSEQRVKKLKDFTQVVDETLPRLTALAQRDLDGALEQLLSLEKRTRLAADAPSTVRVAQAIISLLRDNGKWEMLNEHVSMLCKRRAQMQKVMQAVIQQAAGYVEETPDKETKLKLIEAVRTVSDGKIFVELERARLTKTLADMLEADGKIAEAADTLQDVTVETIGSMRIKEKAVFLLEQLRLFLAKKDFVRAEIISNKVNRDVLNGKGFAELKLKFNRLMIRFYTQAGRHLDTSKAWFSIFNTPVVQQDEAQWREALTNAAVYAVLAPWDYESNELILRLQNEKLMKKLPDCLALLKLFTTQEIIPWPCDALAKWEKYDAVFAVTSDDDDGDDDGNSNNNSDDTKKAMDLSNDGGDDDYDGEEGEDDDTSALFKRNKWALLHKRVVQHNLRVVAKYYARIETPRLAQLLSLSEARAERFLSELVSSKQVFAKIDRPAKHISFRAKRNADETLNEWSADLVELLRLVDSTCHQINKEKMIHKIK